MREMRIRFQNCIQVIIDFIYRKTYNRTRSYKRIMMGDEGESFIVYHSIKS